ncbi:MAG: hypothetical protein ACRDHN_01755 [Thermomicrobiales bacterium]
MVQQSPTLSRRSLIAIATTLTGGAAIGIRDVLAAPPDVAHLPASQSGTPAISADSAIGSLLARSYDPGTGLVDQLPIIAMYADLDLATAGVGIERPPVGASDSDISYWSRMLTGVAFPQSFAYLLTPEWKQYTGCDIAQISQTIEIGEPPDMVSLLAGAFDRETAITAWSDGGYAKIEDDGEIAIYSIAEDAEISLTNPIQKTFLARRNNAAIIGDELIVFASTLDLMRKAIASATGNATPLGSAPGVVALLASTPELASGAFASGSSLQTIPPGFAGLSPDEAATAIADTQEQTPVPPILLALIGVTPGGPMPTSDSSGEATPIPTPETATLELSLLMASDEDAQNAIDLLDERLKTAISYRVRQPFTEWFTSWDLSVAEDAPIARLSIELQNCYPKIWMDLLFSSDFSFLW